MVKLKPGSANGKGLTIALHKDHILIIYLVTGQIEICSPQLLHMTRDGSHLWFNGWIAENKVDRNSKFVQFKSYMRESNSARKSDEWDLGLNNMCCLSGHKFSNFTEEEKITLDAIAQTAIEVGVYKNQ